MQFNGLNDYAESNPNFDFGKGNFTWSFWVKTTQTGIDHSLLSDWNGAGSSDAIVVSVGGTSFFGCNGAANKASFILRDTAISSNAECVTSTTNINDNVWHFVTVQRAGNMIIIYINGTQENLASINPSDDYAPLGTNFAIGGNSGSWLSNALMDEVAIWNRSLTSTEIQQIYNCQSIGSC